MVDVSEELDTGSESRSGKLDDVESVIDDARVVLVFVKACTDIGASPAFEDIPGDTWASGRVQLTTTSPYELPSTRPSRLGEEAVV